MLDLIQGLLGHGLIRDIRANPRLRHEQSSAAPGNYLKNSPTYSRSSAIDGSETIGTTRTVQLAGILPAMRESVITKAVERKPFCHPDWRASRKLSASGCRPAATRIA